MGDPAAPGGFYYLNDEQFDLDSGSEAESAYLVASSPRSGSSLLARALWNRGTAGLPHEYFQRHHREELVQRWGLDGDLEGYVARLRRLRCSPNGVFGFKAHFPQIQESFLDSGIDPFDLFGDLRVVYIYRSDRISQAVSLERAARSGVWTDEKGAWQATDAPIEYRYRRLWRRLRRILAIEKAWEQYFEHRSIDPLAVRFEDLVADVSGSTDRVIDFLGVERHGEPPFPLPELGSQHDASNEELVQRFTTDLAVRGRPDRAAGS